MPILYKRCKCGAKILRQERYCEACSKNVVYKQNKQYDTHTRSEELSAFYKSAQWKKVRAQVLAREPFCRACKRVAQVVDHIVEIKDGGAKVSYDNLQPLCHNCHNKKTADVKSLREKNV
jgi:5-methylcytosine-specific restriction endonuclease McrA